MGNLAALVPVALFLAFAVGLSVVVRHRTQSASDGGGFVKEYQIRPDPMKLVGYGLSFADLTRAVSRARRARRRAAPG